MRRTAPVLSTAAVVCGLLLIAPLPASAAPLGTQDGAALRAAVTAANSTPGTDIIDLATATTYTLTGAGASEDANATGDLDVTDALVVNGNGATIDADGLDRAFDVLAGGSLTLTNVVLTGGVAPVTENGGAVRVVAGSTLTVTTGAMVGNEALNPGAPAATAGSGGAIATAGAITVTGTAFTGNDVTRAGGAIEVLATGTAAVTGATFTGNTTTTNLPGNGGGLHITGAGTATVTNSDFGTNTAAEGGALWNSFAGTLTVTDTDIVDNTADGAAADQGGGGVFTEGGAVTITGGTIEDNQATGAAGSGGGILNIIGTVSVTGTTIADNTAERAGGGIEAGPLLTTTVPAVTGNTRATTTTLTNVDLTGNSFTTPGDASPRNGGGLHLTGAGTVDVVDSTVSGNTLAREGGGLWNSAVGVLTVTGSDITGNETNGAFADQGGGGVFTEGGDVVIADTVIADNDATGTLASGGGILSINGDVLVTDSEITGNTAVRAGGGVEAGPLLDNTVTPATVVNAAPTATVLSGVLLSDNAVTGPPGNGGGLHLTGAGDVLVDTSLVSDNSAVEGGGLWNSAVGSMVVLDTTLTGNVASGTDGGGALYQDGAAGTGGDLITFNTTIDGNTAANGAGGAVLNAGDGVVGLLHTTVTRNGSGVAGAVTLGNSVLTENAGQDDDGDATSLGGNVLRVALPIDPSAAAGATDKTGVLDSRLGALVNNGGPTPTRLPAAGSPVIDAGRTITPAGMGTLDAALIGTDQRGVTRPLDGDGDGRAVVDAGAVEAPAVPVTGGTTPPASPVVAQPNYTG